MEDYEKIDFNGISIDDRYRNTENIWNSHDERYTIAEIEETCFSGAALHDVIELVKESYPERFI